MPNASGCEMFIEGAHAVADRVTPEQLKLGMLFLPQSKPFWRSKFRPLRA